MDPSRDTAALLLWLVPGGVVGVVLALLCGALFIQRRLLRAALARLRESEDRFRTLCEHGGVGLALLDPQGTVVQANPALERLLGHDPGELTGRTFSDLTYAQDVSQPFLHLEETPDDAGPASYEREKRFVRKDGGVVWARVVRSAVRGPSGAVRFHAAALMDVTARRLAEAALAQERDFVAHILNTADALVIVLDPDGRILRFNAKCAAVCGYGEEEVRGRILWDFLLPPPDVPRVRCEFERFLQLDAAPANPTVFETFWRTRGGEDRLIAWRGALSRGADGAQRLLIGVGLDVTDQRRLEGQLAQARKMETLGTLVGGLAHDFNNQLTAVLGNLRLLRDDLQALAARGIAGATALLPAAADAEKAARCCADMTARLLTFSRGGLGAPRRLRLTELLPEAVRLLNEELPPTVRVVVDAPEDVWLVTADAAQILQVVHALVKNARDAMPCGGKVTLALRNRDLGRADWAADVRARPGRFVELLVADDGVGMTPEVQARLFEPFFTTKKTKGGGMGLATAFGVVKGHQGWIAVESAPGQGTTVRVFLPAAPAEAPAPPPAPAECRGAGETVLLVDDEEMVRDLAAIVLQRWGFGVRTASGGKEAVELYRRGRHEVDVVLLDYSMPEMNGLQVLHALKEMNPDVRVVFSSGYALDGDAAPLLAAGGKAFVAKPYHPEELVQALRRALDARTTPRSK
jgi:PAS domain S-box-containing protein